jgi:UPF0755 protein
VGAAIAFFVGAFWYANLQLSPVSNSSGTVLVDIPPGSGAAQIGSRLQKAGVIRSPLAFTLMAKILGESSEMKAGEYRLPRNLGVVEVINQLVQGSHAESQWVTIPEGWTLRQIANQLDSQRLVRTHEFMRAVRRKPSAYGLPLSIPRASVEGYLMPDSYKVPVKTSERKIVAQLVKNWKDKVWLPNEALFRKSDLPPDKVIILASMIEREARVSGDRPLISSVIHNRLKKKMKLQIDATVLYALGKHKDIVTFADLKVNSPFNTYRNVGLPPGPICNPGLDAIKAALQPAESDYLYYVAKPDGSHIFTRTAEEHSAAIAKARALRREASAGSNQKQP